MLPKAVDEIIDTLDPTKMKCCVCKEWVDVDDIVHVGVDFDSNYSSEFTGCRKCYDFASKKGFLKQQIEEDIDEWLTI